MVKSPTHGLHLSTCPLPCRVISVLATCPLGHRTLCHSHMRAERGNRCEEGRDHLMGDSLKSESAHHAEFRLVLPES